MFNRQGGRRELGEGEKKARMTKRGSLGRRRGTAGQRGGSHSVCGERSFLNASFIQEHFVCIRALVLRSYCGGLS